MGQHTGDGGPPRRAARISPRAGLAGAQDGARQRRDGPPGRRRPTPAASVAGREALETRRYDPRRDQRREASRLAVPDDVQAAMLDGQARRELRSLSQQTADLTARHLVMVGRLLDSDPMAALAHARAARALAGRVAVVREAAGLAAYAAQEWAEALGELRAARRISGRPEHVAVMADCERGLGRPERALALGQDPVVASLPVADRIEVTIVLAGARRDLGQLDAALLLLAGPARRTAPVQEWAGRLWYAYADLLAATGQGEAARAWFAKAVDADPDGVTDAADRLLELDGVRVLADDDVEAGSAAPVEAPYAGSAPGRGVDLVPGSALRSEADEVLAALTQESRNHRRGSGPHSDTP